MSIAGLTPSRSSSFPMRRRVLVLPNLAAAFTMSLASTLPGPGGAPAEFVANPAIGPRQAAEARPIVHGVHEASRSRRVDGGCPVGSGERLDPAQPVVADLDQGERDAANPPFTGQAVVVGVEPVGDLIIPAVAMKRSRAAHLIAAVAVANERLESHELARAPTSTRRNAPRHEVQSSTDPGDQVATRQTAQQITCLDSRDSQAAGEVCRVDGRFPAHLDVGERLCFEFAEGDGHGCVVFSVNCHQGNYCKK